MSAPESCSEHPKGAEAGRASSVVLLAALGALVLAKWRDDALALYVHPGFVPVLALTGLALCVLAAVRLWQMVAQAARSSVASTRQAISWGVALIGLAVVVGALVPARPLGSAAAANQSSELPPPPLVALTDETEGWTLLEWAQALSGGMQRERLAGRRVSVVGFVHRPKQGGADGETLVARFVVRCCAADGLAVSLPVRHSKASALAADTWVRVEGALRLVDEDGRTVAFVEADRLTVVPVPPTPYLVPS